MSSNSRNLNRSRSDNDLSSRAKFAHASPRYNLHPNANVSANMVSESSDSLPMNVQNVLPVLTVAQQQNLQTAESPQRDGVRASTGEQHQLSVAPKPWPLPINLSSMRMYAGTPSANSEENNSRPSSSRTAQIFSPMLLQGPATIMQDPSASLVAEANARASAAEAQAQQTVLLAREAAVWSHHQIKNASDLMLAQAEDKISAACSAASAAEQNANLTKLQAEQHVQSIQSQASNIVASSNAAASNAMQQAEQEIIQVKSQAEGLVTAEKQRVQAVAEAVVDQETARLRAFAQSEVASVVASAKAENDDLKSMVQKLSLQVSQMSTEFANSQQTVQSQHDVILRLQAERQAAAAAAAAIPPPFVGRDGVRASFPQPSTQTPVQTMADYNAGCRTATSQFQSQNCADLPQQPTFGNVSGISFRPEISSSNERMEQQRYVDSLQQGRVSTQLFQQTEQVGVSASPAEHVANPRSKSKRSSSQRHSSKALKSPDLQKDHNKGGVAFQFGPSRGTEPEVLTATPTSSKCTMCGGSHFVWYPQWNSFACSACAYPQNQNQVASVQTNAASSWQQVPTFPMSPAANRPQFGVAGSVRAPPSAGSTQWTQPAPQQQQNSQVPQMDFNNLNLDGDSAGDFTDSGEDSEGSGSPSSSSSSDDEGGGHPGGGPPGGGSPDGSGGPPNHFGGGPPGGPPGPPGPPDYDGFNDLLGGDPDGQPDLSWSVTESDCYKDKDLQSVSMPDIPNDAAGSRTFWNLFKNELSAIDRSIEDVLTKWADIARSLLGPIREVSAILDQNSQGLIRLDRHIAKLIAAKAKDHPIFAVKFASYIEMCHSHNRAPRGRVMLAMIAQRFRLDRARGKAITMLHLYDTELASFKIQDVQNFVNNVRYILANLQAGEIRDPAMMYDWLFEKFRSWSAISVEIRKIRKSKVGSRRRTWKYLWGAIHSYLEVYYEDANHFAVKKALAGPAGKAPGLAAAKGKPKKPKKTKIEDDGVSASPPVTAPGAVADKGKGKTKGKGKGKGKAKAVPAPPNANSQQQSLRDQALNTKPDQRTPEQKKLIGCRFHVTGNCLSGDKCLYSHKPEDIERTKKRMAAAAKKQEEQNAQPKAEPKAASAKAKGKVKASAAVVAGLAAVPVDDAAPIPNDSIQTPKSSNWGITKFLKKGIKAFSGAAIATANVFLPTNGSITNLVEHPANHRVGLMDTQTAPVPCVTASARPHVSGSPDTSFCSVFALASKNARRRMIKHLDVPNKNLFNEFELEYIDDSGAGRPILSVEGLTQQGIPKTAINENVEKASTPMIFECGGGDVPSDNSLSITSPILGKTEAYLLPGKSPIAMSMGEIVQKGRPLVWETDKLPFHATDASKLQISCPLKYRLYADRIEENVPIFKETVRLGGAVNSKANINLPQIPAIPALKDGSVRAPPDSVVATGELDLDQCVTIPDVPTDATPDQISSDVSIRTRKMSVRNLILEANSTAHKRDHYPHNPYCPTCVRSHMRQRSVCRLKEREDDQLPAVKKVFDRISADHMITQKSTEGKIENNVAFTVRDEWSGAGIACPRRTRSLESNRVDLKHFVGVKGPTRPNILVKSDAANEIVGAVKMLGWMPEPSLQNRWPHNTTHERWLGTLKSVIRAAVCQSGVPDRIVDWSVPYSAMALALKQPCPMHPHDKDKSGNILPHAKHRTNWSCWTAFHGGEQFTGKRPIFGQLCFYLDDKAHTLMPRTSAGIFVGWKLESGLRYRGVLQIADYETLRSGSYKWNQIKSIHEKEVHFPEEPSFPFAVARDKALEDMSTATLPKIIPLPFDEELGIEAPKAQPPTPVPPKIKPNYRLSLSRLIKYGRTPGCEGCGSLATNKHLPHTDACKKRFAELLGKSQLEITAEEIAIEPCAGDQGGVSAFAPPPTPGPAATDARAEMAKTYEERINALDGDDFGKLKNILKDDLGIKTDDNGDIQIHVANYTILQIKIIGEFLDKVDSDKILEEELFGDVEDDGVRASPPSPLFPIIETDDEAEVAPSAFSASAKLAKQLKGWKVSYNMTDYVKQSIEHYQELSGVEKLKKSPTPFCPEGALLPVNDESKGDLGMSAASILMKVLWAARLAHPDLSRPTCKLTSNVQKWSVNDDKRLRRLIEYMNLSQDYVLEGFICDPPEDLELWLFVDADLASDPDCSRSTNGAFLVLVGPSTWMPLAWLNTKQTSTAKSTTEAEGVSLVTALLQEAYPVRDLLELLLGREVKLRIKEDNTATIKVLKKGYSSKLRHVQRTHKLNLGVVKEAIDDQSVYLEHVETTKQAADIFTKDLAPAKWPAALELLGIKTPVAESDPSKCGGASAPTSGAPDDKLYDPAVAASASITNQGAITACKIIDDIIANFDDPSCDGVRASPTDIDQALHSAAAIVKGAIASSSSSKRGRPSGKLKGHGKLIELCTDEASTLGKASEDFPKVEVLRVTKMTDLSDPETVRQLVDLIKANPGISIHGSLPCTPWTTWQEMNIHKLGPEFLEKLLAQRKASSKLVSIYIMLSELILELGGHCSFEWPKTCKGWLLPQLLSFITKHNLFSCCVDGCSLDMVNCDGDPILKRWRFVTSSKRTYDVMSTFKCQHPPGFKHGAIQGSDTAKTAFYPIRLCRALLSSLFGWYECTPCMPVVPSVPQNEHREKECESKIPVECVCASPAVSSNAQVEVRVPSCVHTLLNWNQTRTDPKAIAAVRGEVEALADVGTWDSENVIERDELIEWARKSKTTIHVGEGLGICSVKNSELPEGDARRKHKGRFCYRAPTARDEGGAIAIFQEMASRPTTIVSLNVAIAYGCFDGHSTTMADAIKAYVQSYLNSPVPTYIEIPKHLCPSKWKHMKRPCCLLVRALYGHPEAGGHWEVHLTKVVKEHLGGNPVPGHPSCFWFSEKKLFLIIYVDDLLLSGPSSHHEQFWKDLGAHVNIEKPEPVDRYLGRHHSYEPVGRLEYNLLESFDSPIIV